MRVLLAISLMIFLAGCAEMPIKDGELVVNANTTATLDDIGVARINNKF